MPRWSLDRGAAAGWLGAWGFAVAVGMPRLGDYAAWPGDPGAPPARWPLGTDLRPDDRRPTLLIFVPARRPCSRASLAELATLLDRCDGRVSARAVPFRPRHDRGGWIPADLEAVLAAIPGLEFCPDPGGAEARRFVAATSGHVPPFDDRGDRVFSGGITPGRGERGESQSRAALLGQIIGAGANGPESPVFGRPMAPPRSSPGQDRRP